MAAAASDASLAGALEAVLGAVAAAVVGKKEVPVMSEAGNCEAPTFRGKKPMVLSVFDDGREVHCKTYHILKESGAA